MKKKIFVLSFFSVFAMSLSGQECTTDTCKIISIDSLSSKYYNYAVVFESDSLIKQVWWNKSDAAHLNIVKPSVYILDVIPENPIEFKIAGMLVRGDATQRTWCYDGIRVEFYRICSK